MAGALMLFLERTVLTLDGALDFRNELLPNARSIVLNVTGLPDRGKEVATSVAIPSLAPCGVWDSGSFTDCKPPIQIRTSSGSVFVGLVGFVGFAGLRRGTALPSIVLISPRLLAFGFLCLIHIVSSRLPSYARRLAYVCAHMSAVCLEFLEEHTYTSQQMCFVVQFLFAIY